MKKHYYSLSAVVLTVLALVACHQEEPTPSPSQGKDIVIASVDNLVFLPEGGTGTIAVETDQTFSVVSDKAWCTVSSSGKTVTVSVTANPSLESRYARLELKAGTTTQRVVVQQVGEVFGGLNGVTDVTAPVDGTVVEIPYVTNMDLEIKPDKDWIGVELLEDERSGKTTLRITIAENTAIGVRTGKINYSAGSQSGTINVLQYPAVTRSEAWTLGVEEGSFTYPHQLNTVTVTADASVADQKYVFTVVPKSDVSGSVEDYIFDVFAIAAKREIEEAVAAGTYASFADGLVSGNQSKVLEDLPTSVYVMLVGYDDYGYVSGLYQWAEVSVADKVPLYYRWPGTWEVSSGDFKEVWTISLDENHLEESLIIDGLNSITTTSVVNNNAAQMVLTYNEDGTISLKNQKGKEFKYSDSYGTCTMQVQGRITTNEGASYSRITTMGLTVFSCALSEDFSTATMTQGEAKVAAGTFPFVQMRLWLVRNDTGGTYSLSGSSGVMPLPLAMKRID